MRRDIWERKSSLLQNISINGGLHSFPPQLFLTPMYILQRQQQLETELDDLWRFLKNPYNLNIITPPDLNFEIVSDVPDTMFEGLIIEYRITIPFIGHQRWVTEIKHIRENYSFVDEQRLGPYTFWYHYHEITLTKTGVLSSDTVYYQPPLGPVGKILNKAFISRTLNRIFDYRKKKIQDIFPDKTVQIHHKKII